GAEPQLEIEIAVDRNTIFDLTPAIVCGQLCAFVFRKIDIRVIKERREIVFGKTGSHSLEIDKVRLTVSDDDVLRLKIAVHQNSRERCQAICDFLHRRQGRQLREPFFLDFEKEAEAILEKVILFPKIKLRIELVRQMLHHLDANRFGKRVQRRDLIEGRFVERAAHQPAFVAITVEVELAKVFQPDQTFVSVMKVNLWHTNSVLGKKVRDRYVVA